MKRRSKPLAVCAVRPTTRRTLRAFSGRRIIVEGYGRKAATFVAIVGASDVPTSAWLSPRELRRFVEAAKKILK